jgi:hypothetical protein
LAIEKKGGKMAKSEEKEEESSDIERIKAQIEALKEEKKALSENISTIAENVGEVRGITIEQGRKMAYIETEAKKAASLVESVKPETFMKEISVINEKINVLRQKLQDNEKLSKQFINELKENRKLLVKFRGIESMTKPLTEIKTGLLESKKIQLRAERDSLKSEKIFVELQTRFKDIELLKKRVEDIELSFNNIIKDFNNIKIRLVSAR